MKKLLSLGMAVGMVMALQGCGGGGSQSDSSGSSSYGSESKTQSNGGTEGKGANLINNSTNESTSGTNQISSNDNTYLLIESIKYKEDQNITTKYSYKDGLIYETNSTSTNGDKVDRRYDYNESSKQLKVYVKNILGNMELSQIAKFEDGKRTSLNYNYLYFTYSSIEKKKNVHLVEVIKDIEKGLNTAYKYSYKDGSLDSIAKGYYDSLDGKMIVENKNILADTDITTTNNGDSVIVKDSNGKKLIEYKFEKISE
ncbi:MAG: hypothetical protein DSZ06_04645 [Sulfurospirillum sp.]|nr:MAG: hypothetical protein DSZ06_04645 [Sulfurospirillum sp.]